jgi:predicted nucleotide-binding protein
LQARPIYNPDEYYREAAKWSEYNEELLKIVFTTESVYEKYVSGYVGLLPDNEAQALHFRRMTVDDDIAKLESIVERLELYPEPSVPAVGEVRPPHAPVSSKVFVVHGHDEGPREAVARFLERLGVQPIILHEQANQGRTVMEKIEAHGDVSFAVVLLTPDDEGCVKGGSPLPRARQNVVLELGYFIARLGRKHVCALKRGDLELPSDFAGVVYEPFDAAGAWKAALGRELQEAGFVIDWNVVMRP